MPIPATWLERHQQRHDWALQAFDRFVHELAPEVSSQVRRSQQVTVVVYGATQVGKTTLILDLLGVASSTEDEAGRVLRGGQALGKSATAMPLRYGRAPDDHWYIGSEQSLAESQAIDALAKVRRAVELGEWRGTDLIDILIPGRLFPPFTGDALDVDVKLIDLPGLNARNRHEQALVEELARRYVTVADLVLLVTQASSLGFLLPENLQIEELAHWASQPVRFRVVLTSWFSLGSERTRWLATPPDVQLLRQSMISEIGTFGLKIPPRFADNLYALEMGDSAREIACGDPAYHACIAPVVTAFRQQLITDIKDASGPFSRVFAAFQLDAVVQGQVAVFRAQHEAREAELDEQRLALEKQLSKHYPNLDGEHWLAELRSHQAGFQAEYVAHKQLGDCINKLLRRVSIQSFENHFAAKPMALGPETVSTLQGALDEQKEHLQARAGDWLRCVQFPAVNDETRERLLKCAEQLPTFTFDDKDFHPIAYHLDSYSTDSYFWSSNFRNDCTVLELAVTKSQQRHAALAYKGFVDGFRAQAALLEKKLPVLKMQKATAGKYIEKLQAQHDARVKLYNELTTNLARMDSSLQIAKHFEQRLNQAFLHNLDVTKAGIATGAGAVQKFLSVLNTHMLINEAEKLYTGKPLK